MSRYNNLYKLLGGSFKLLYNPTKIIPLIPLIARHCLEVLTVPVLDLFMGQDIPPPPTIHVVAHPTLQEDEIFLTFF